MKLLRRSTDLLVATLVGLMGASCCLAANTLVITAPANGAVVNPGQLLTVKVTATGNYPNGVAIVGGSPEVSSQGFQSGSNLTFTITVPPKARAGRFGLSAVAASSTGALVSSAEVRLDVERPDTPQSLRIEPPAINLEFIGDNLSVDTTGTFADGSRFLMTNSSLLQVSPANPNVAIFRDGRVVAAGPGSTQVTFSVGATTQGILVTVPNSARGDLNRDTRVDQSDVDILSAALNTPAMIANDARDLDQDGQITTADRTILQSLCTVQKPKCSTH